MSAPIWKHDLDNVDWQELSELYRIAPLGVKPPEYLRTVYGNSRIRCLLYEGTELVGAGRALSDGGDCSYICDVVIHPDHQGTGLGGQLIRKLIEMSHGHRKIILYANPGREGFYARLGFRPMRTAMAIFSDQEGAIRSGLLAE